MRCSVQAATRAGSEAKWGLGLERRRVEVVLVAEREAVSVAENTEGVVPVVVGIEEDFDFRNLLKVVVLPRTRKVRMSR